MNRLLVLCALLACARAMPQESKSVKGGHGGGGGYLDTATADLVRRFNQDNNTQYQWNQNNQPLWNQASQQSGQQVSGQQQWGHNQQQSGQQQWNQNSQQSGQSNQQWAQNQQQSGQQQSGYNQQQSGQQQWGHNQQQLGQQWGNTNQQLSGQQQWGHNQQQLGQNQQQWGQNGYNLTRPNNFEQGVCYKEVPTASLIRDRSNVPRGNGSRPELSRIRLCCDGYIRNIHNFKICDPVCTPECVNALCTAPNVCSCFPNHVINSGGYCVATCPLGCQNGHCQGGECMCKEGYRLDVDGKFCTPYCRANCGGLGNCTAPNTCDCKEGYKSTPDGSCRDSCGTCTNGVCVRGDCQCSHGYVKMDGDCLPYCPRGCGTGGQCTSPGHCTCQHGYELDQSTAQCRPAQISVQPLYPQLPPQSGSQLNSHQLNSNHFNSSQLNANQQLDSMNSLQLGCPQPCINGVCAEHGCTCNYGYEADPTDPTRSRCLPRCPGGCPNGICSAPNLCLCNAGFVKDRSVKGRPTCVKRAKRSLRNLERPKNLETLLLFEIPDEY